MRAAVVLYLAGALLWAQPANVGGDACGYRWYTHLANVPDSTPSYNWIDSTSLQGLTYDHLLADDNFIGPIPLPTPFVYYWNTYDQLFIGSNGYVTFLRSKTLASLPPPYFYPFPYPDFPNAVIAPYLADLTFTDGNGNRIPSARLYYGTTADGKFVITWDSVPYYNGSSPGEWDGRTTFQLILNPGDSSITFQYKEITGGWHPGYSNGNYNVVGMENRTGQIGLNIASKWNPPIQNYAIKIWHPRTLQCSVRDIEAEWVLTPGSEGIFVLKGGLPPTLEARWTNAGNRDIVDTNVISVLRIAPPGGPDFYRDTVLFSPPRAVGGGWTATFTKPFNTSGLSTSSSLNTSSYSARNIIRLRLGNSSYNDAFLGNNEVIGEIVACDTPSTGAYAGKYILRYDDGNWDPANDDIGGIGFAHGMTFVAPQDIVVEAISVDMLYREDLTDTYPLALWVYDYDPVNGAVGSQRDSVGIDLTDFANGDSLNRFQDQGGAFYALRRYSVPLTTPIPLLSGQGLAVGFRTLHPSGATNVSNYVVSDASAPISRRALEGIGGVWAPARNLEEEDYAIGLVARLDVSSAAPAPVQLPAWGFTVFPNPASDAPFVRVELPAPGPVTFRLVDLTGKVLWQETREIPTPSYKLRLPAGLSAGTYLLGVTYQGFTKGQRIVIE